MPQQLTFEPQPKREPTLCFFLAIKGKLPSWNDIVSMEQWQRYHYKEEAQLAFLSALEAFGGSCWTKTTCAKNMWSIAADTLACYRATAQVKRKSRLASKKLIRAQRSLFGSKSTSGKVPF